MALMVTPARTVIHLCVVVMLSLVSKVCVPWFFLLNNKGMSIHRVSKERSKKRLFWLQFGELMSLSGLNRRAQEPQRWLCYWRVPLTVGLSHERTTTENAFPQAIVCCVCNLGMETCEPWRLVSPERPPFILHKWIGRRKILSGSHIGHRAQIIKVVQGRMQPWGNCYAQWGGFGLHMIMLNCGWSLLTLSTALAVCDQQWRPWVVFVYYLKNQSEVEALIIDWHCPAIGCFCH